jgi:hypothetical protein
MKQLNITIMKKNLYQFTTIFLLCLFSSTVFGQQNILYVGKTDDPVDTKMMEFLYEEGYSPIFVSEDDFKNSPYDEAAGYDGYDAIFISEVVGSGSVVNFKNAGFPIPCVSTEGYCVRVDRWDFITNNDEQFKQASSADLNSDILTLVIEDADNWITSNYDTPYDLVWSTAEDPTALGVTGCKLNENVPDAVELGVFLQDIMADFPSFWAIPEGSTLISDNSVTLPNIVVLGVIGPGLGDYATDDYNMLVVNSLKWVTGDYEIPEDIISAMKYDLNVWPNPTNGIVNVSFDLPLSGNVRINVYNVTGSLVKTLVSDYLTAGNNTLQVDLSGMADAQYFYEIHIENEILRGKICKN